MVKSPFANSNSYLQMVKSPFANSNRILQMAESPFANYYWNSQMATSPFHDICWFFVVCSFAFLLVGIHVNAPVVLYYRHSNCASPTRVASHPHYCAYPTCVFYLLVVSLELSMHYRPDPPPRPSRLPHHDSHAYVTYPFLCVGPRVHHPLHCFRIPNMYQILLMYRAVRLSTQCDLKLVMSAL